MAEVLRQLFEIIMRHCKDKALCRDGTDMLISLYKQNRSKLPDAEVLSLHRHLALILEHLCTQQYSQSS